MNIKDGWNASNHNLNYLPHAIAFQCHILCFDIWELNVQALAQRRENSAAASKVLPSGADLAALQSSQSCAYPEFLRPQTHRDGSNPDAMIKDFRALLDYMEGATHSVAIYSGTRVFIKHKSGHKMYISDEQLHTMELCMYHSIQVQVVRVDGELILQMCWCTGSQSWCEGDWQNDWVWVRQCLGRYYGALNGYLLWQMQRLFKIKHLNKDGAFVKYWLAPALNSIPENFGNLDVVSKFVHVRQALVVIALQVFSGGNIVGCAHVIPEIATSSKTGDGQNERCIGNSHIDLATRNNVYNYWRENCILRTGRTNARRDFRSVTHSIAIPMQTCTLWIHSDVWSQLATTSEWSSEIGDWQNESKYWNSDRRVICNAMRWNDAGRKAIRHTGVSDGSYWVCPLRRSHSTQTESLFADAQLRGKQHIESQLPSCF